MMKGFALANYHPDIKEDWESIICDMQHGEVERFEKGIEIDFTLICFIGKMYFDFDGHVRIADENGERQPVWNNYEIHDYLRSKSYDVGFGSCTSLIEAGHAIDNSLK